MGVNHDANLAGGVIVFAYRTTIMLSSAEIIDSLHKQFGSQVPCLCRVYSASGVEVKGWDH